MCAIQNESVSPFKALLSPRVSFWNFPNFLLRHQNTVPSDRVSMYSNRNDFKTIPPPGLPMALNALLETAFIGTAGAAPQSPLFLPPSLPSASDVDLRPPPADRRGRRASPPLSLPPSQTAIGEALSRQGFRRRRQRERASERGYHGECEPSLSLVCISCHPSLPFTFTHSAIRLKGNGLDLALIYASFSMWQDNSGMQRNSAL